MGSGVSPDRLPDRLRSASGATWFAAPGSGSSIAGRVELHGAGFFSALTGTSLDKAVAEAGGVRYGTLAEALTAVGPGGTVTLLANATAPASLLNGRTIIDNGWDVLPVFPSPRATIFYIQ